MNYIASLQALFQSSEHRLSERSKILDMEFNFSVDLLPDYDQIAELIQSFPDRDIVGVSLTNENDDIFYLSSTDLSAKSKYDSFKDECEYSEQISAKISINKDIQNGLISIYSFSSFSEELCDLSLDGVMTTFSALLNESSQLIFEVFDTDILFKTKTMLFSSAPQRVVFQNFDRKSRLNACSEGMSSEVDRGICRYACLWGAFILVSLIAVEMISEEPIIRPLLQQLFAMIKSSIN